MAGIEVNIGGVWKTVSGVEVNVGGVWKTVSAIENNVGGVWKASYSGVTPPEVALGTVSNNTNKSSGACVCNIKIDSDGDAYKSTNTGSYGASFETWLDVGLNSQVWISRTITSGTLTLDQIGAGRVACTASKQLGVTTTSNKSAQGVLSFWDAASGGNLLDTANYFLTASVGGGGP